MLRRTPTRIELKIDDLEEFEAAKKARELEQKKQKAAAESGNSSIIVTPEVVGNKSRTDVHQRIGYDPKPLPQPSRLPHWCKCFFKFNSSISLTCSSTTLSDSSLFFHRPLAFITVSPALSPFTLFFHCPLTFYSSSTACSPSTLFSHSPLVFHTVLPQPSCLSHCSSAALSPSTLFFDNPLAFQAVLPQSSHLPHCSSTAFSPSTLFLIFILMQPSH